MSAPEFICVRHRVAFDGWHDLRDHIGAMHGNALVEGAPSMAEVQVLEAQTSSGGRYCGTFYGYQIHRRVPERACDMCKQAVRDYQRDLAARRRNGEPPRRMGRPRAAVA